MYSKIIGTGGYLPKKILTNKDLESIVDTTDEWILERTGIKQRHIAEENETTSSMATQASLDAINSAGIKESDIDLIIVATTTPDQIFPSTACIVQNKLNIKAPAFDVQAACTGFIYALSIADNYIKTGMNKNVLVIGAEKYSNLLDWSDRSTCVLFGDGAGAVVLSAQSKEGIISSHIHADGQYNDLLSVENSHIKMKGNEVFKVAVNTLSKLVDETLTKNNMKKSDIDWLVPHQANLRIIKAAARKLSMPIDKVVVTVDNHANTSAASIPLALNEAVKDGRIKSDQVILLEAFGSGFTWGSVLLRY
ncbi:MAG: ketoacyl-ACP synthase III [Gammaproteobacteria bacterium]|jgi:3-oxoacyl-[acyl-carrier-protein] synthase III|nr:ketoacyl-ACP synthase III [Gammaproteobacteria bacterium]MBT7814409.1 ketoacyl-ACP synthase III [Gammaproteobacteria bacterium]